MQLINFVWAVTYFNYNKSKLLVQTVDTPTKGSRELFVSQGSLRNAPTESCAHMCNKPSFFKKKLL